MRTENDFLKIEPRCQRAQPAPWHNRQEGKDHYSGSHFIMTGPTEGRGDDLEFMGGAPADWEFVAQARVDIPLLIAEVIKPKSAAGQSLLGARSDFKFEGPEFKFASVHFLDQFVQH